MDAAVVHTFGEAPCFERFPDPTPGDGEVLAEVRAAGLHPVVKALASGTHYGSTGELPLIPGVDGVGVLEDGTRVYFSGAQPPYGTMAERTVVSERMCFPLPESVDDEIAAALVNPGIASWLALTWRARLEPGETVLVLGATGASGQLAVQMAKGLGAGRIIAAGRNEQILKALPDLGADATVHLNTPNEELSAAIAKEASEEGIHVIVDYLWGLPTEAVLAAISRKGLTHTSPRVRLVEVGESAGPTITLPAAVLRSSGLEIYGTGFGTPPIERVFEELPRFFDRVVKGEFHLGVEVIPLAEVGAAWQRNQEGRRVVVIP